MTFLLFIFLCLIIHLHCSQFLIIPLLSYKKNNIDLPSNDPQFNKFLNLNSSLTNLIEGWYLQTVLAELSVGNPQLKLMGEFKKKVELLECVRNDKFQSKNNLNIFGLSKTIKGVNMLNKYENYPSVTFYGDIYDDFYFTLSDNLNSSFTTKNKTNLKFTFYAVYTAHNDSEFDTLDLSHLNITFSFVLGMKIEEDYSKGRSCFVKDLKDNGVIPSFDFSFDFYNNITYDTTKDYDQIGRIIFGEFEQIYNKHKYPERNLRTTKMISNANTVDYKMFISETYLEKNEKIHLDSQFIEFVFDQSLITGVDDYKTLIEGNFFNKYESGKMCEKQTILFHDESRVIPIEVFVCDRELIEKHKKEFPILKFYSRDMDYTFEFGYEDLFREYMGKVYFMVIFPSYRENPLDWTFGKIFLRKYQLFFNVESKTIRLYSELKEKPKEGSSFPKWLKIILEIIMIGLLLCVAYYFGKILNRKRKMRAQELDDTYDYIEKSPNNKMVLN